jgi:DNA repair exonuclease SbcCD nuclease subunit
LPTFIHTADWQIGRQFSSFPEADAVPLAEARVEAVSRIASLAVHHAVDAVLVAGDVFELQAVSDRTIRQMFNAMKAFGGPWVLISGNHDAALAESVWTRAQRLGAVPGHVHLALASKPVLLGEQGLAVLPAPLTQRHTFDDATAWFDHADTPEGMVRVGLAHGSVQGILAEDIDSPNPIAADRAATARLDYLALGDWHGCKRIDERTWYSGTPEPDRFKSNDAGHALLVRIDAPGALPQVSVLDTARHTWQAWSCRLDVASDVDAVVARLAVLGETHPQAVLSLQLQGKVDLAAQQRIRHAVDEALAHARHIGVDFSGLQLSPTDDDIAALQADGYLADLLGELRDTQAQSPDAVEQAVAREALAILAGLLSERRGVPTEGGQA